MNDPVAEFLAKGGKITRVAAGVTAYDINDIYEAARNGGRACPIAKRAAEAAEYRAERAREFYQDARAEMSRETAQDETFRRYPK